MELSGITGYFGGLWDAGVRSGKISVKAATEQERESSTLVTTMTTSADRGYGDDQTARAWTGATIGLELAP